MAQRVQVLLEDDIDGGEAVETLLFSVRGTEYEIDLNEKNLAKFDKVLATFVGNARRVGRSSPTPRRGRATSNSEKRDLRAVREWAKDNGYSVSDRGRVSGDILEAYDAAN